MLQIDRAMESLRLKFLRGWSSYEGIQRVETYPVPLEALREALLNAVIHKDYASCVPIQMRIYDDEIRLFNNGYLPDNWTLEKLLGVHGSQPYNPDIAHCFFRAGQIESWGQGVSKIFKLCQEDGLPAPRYDLDGSSFTVHLTIHLPPHEGGGLRMIPLEQDNDQINDRIKLTATEQSVLEALQENPQRTIEELMDCVEKSDKTIRRSLKTLQEQGLIERVGSRKTGHWQVKGEPHG